MYAGNSPQKAARRADAYGGLSRQDFLRKLHIVIASRDCGDIKFLLEHGVPADNIIACDIDSRAMVEAHHLGVQRSPYPDIVHTVVWALKEYGARAIASINIDLCDSLRSTLSILLQILGWLDSTRGNNITVWLTFSRGRQDGFRSEQARRTYLGIHTPSEWIITEYQTYQSWSYLTKGYPMCLAQFNSTTRSIHSMTTAAAKKAWATRRANAKKATRTSVKKSTAPKPGKKPGKPKNR